MAEARAGAEGVLPESMHKLLPTLPSAVLLDLLSLGVRH